MTNFYFNLNQIQSNPDGEPTVNRQSRLMSLRGKKAEKEQLSRDCLRDASELPLTCPRPDSLSLVSRQSDLDQVRAVSAGLSTRVWKHVAMIFAVLVMSIGQMWGEEYATSTFFQAVSKATTASITPTEANAGTGDFITKDCSEAFTITSGGSAVIGYYSTSNGTTAKTWEYSSSNGGLKSKDVKIWIVLYSSEQFVAGDSIVIANGNNSNSGAYTIVGAAANNTSDFHEVSAVVSPSTTTPAKNTNYYYILPNTFTSSNYLVIRNNNTGIYFGGIYAYHKAAPASSDSYDIHIGKNNADYTDESLTNTSGTTWSKTITLDAGSYYEFKVKKTPSAGDAVWYGNNGKITATTSPAWDFSTSADNCKLYTTVSGSYTFSWDTSTSKLTVTYPAGSHPTKRIYMACGSTWCDASPKFFVHSWGVTEEGVEVQQNACGDYYADIIWYNDYFQFTRNSSAATAYDNNQWNVSQDLTYDSEKLLWTCTGWSGDPSKGTFSKSVYSPTTYTISYAKGSTTYTGGNAISGSKANETKTCGVDFILPSSAVFSTTGYTQTGWTTSDGGSQTHALGGSYTENAAQAFYPVWTVKSHTLTWDFVGGSSNLTEGTNYTAHGSVNYGTTLTYPTNASMSKTGYNFSAWSSTPSTMPDNDLTITAQWTAKTTTITINANTSNHGSTTPGTVTATYGSALPSFTAATGASGYSLTGYFTDATSGTKIINADGTLVASTDYADGSGNWKSEDATLTLFAQYEEDADEECTNEYNSPATTTYATKTFLDVSSTNYNTSASTNYYLTYSAYWMHNTYKTWTWWNSNDAGSNKEGSTYTYDNATSEGYLATASSASGNNGYGGKKIHSTRRDSIWFTGATSVACLNKGNSSAIFTMEVFQVASNGTLSKVGNSYTNATTNVTSLVCSSLNASNYYLVKFYATAASNTYLYQVRFGNACAPTPSCTTPDAPTAFANTAVTSTTATFSITDDADAASYDLYYASGSPSTPIAGTAATENVTTKTPTITGLTASTTYKIWARSVCDASHKSDWVALTGSSFETSAAAGTTYYLVTSTAQLNTTDTYVIMEASGAAMMGIATGSNSYLNAITSGFTAAADKSTVTVTSSDVNTLTLKSESDAWNLFGKDNHYITTNSTVNGNLYGNATSGSGTDDFVFSFTDGKAIINRPSSSYHIYYSSGTGFNQSTSSTNIRLYTSNSMPVYTVTYDLNGGEGTLPTNRPEKSGTSITLASSIGLTKSGYTFDGWLCSVNSTKYAAGASYTMTAANTTFTAQWEAVSGYTVTYKYNGATSGATPTSETGTSVTLPTPTRTGYELDGWYTTAGEKVGNGGETYGPEANITLYARWQKACDAGGVAKSTTDVAASGYTTYQEVGGSNVVFTSAPSIGFKYKDADGNTINSSTTAVVRNNAYSCQIKSSSSNKGSIKTNNAYSNVDSISFYFAASDKGGCQVAVWCSTDDFSADSTQLLSATTYADNNSEFKLKTLAIPSGKKASALRFKFRFTVTSSGKTSYIDSLKVYSSTSGGGTCYHVYYHGNGAESGYVNDTVSYTAGSKATVLNYNYGRNPLAKTGYDFRGWATSASGAVAYSAGQKIDITSADVDLYAVWATASSALVTWEKKVNVATWTDNTTPSTTDPTNIGTIGSSATLIASPGATSGKTPQIQLASGASNADKGASFTFSMKSADKVVVPTKVSCEVANVGSGSNSDITYKAVLTDGTGNTYYSTNSICPDNNGTLNPIEFVFSSGLSLRGDITVKVYGWISGSGSGFSFRMGPDIKFYGTVEDYVCADPSAPTISGVSAYVPGETITLTASHDGENYDNLTTYTWYKGADWATASGTTPVQAAATGEDGYIFTKATCAAGDAGLYWCEAANGTCKAHSAAGYDVTVFPAYTITYHLDGGSLDGTEKTSYTQFDEDYTLPTPTKTGSVFAGWYGASDYSGLPTVVLGAGSVGNKEYYAKWGAVVTVSWTVTKVDGELYRGGGGYSVKAVINETDWSTGFMDELELTATEGVTLKNIEVSENGESKVQVTADFDITTDLAADATSITFTLNVPADGKYGPKVDEHEEELTSCAGSSTVWNFAYASDDRPTLTNSNASTEGNKNTLSATTGSGNLYYFAGSSDAFETDKYLKMNGASSGGSVNSRSVYQNRCFYIDITSNGTLTIQQYADNGNGAPKYVVANTRPLQSDYPSSSVAPTTTGGATYEINVTNYSSGTADRIWVAYPTAKAYIISVIWTPTGGGGTVTPTLTWETDLSSTVEKVTGDADFTHYVTQNKNSLGTITYSSNDETVATVNATTGKVHIVGAEGTATITATLAASGCFNGATATYTISVVDNCIDVPGTIAWTDLGCDGIQMTVSGHTGEGAGATYQWYKDDAVVSGATEITYTATAAGEYYVVVTNTGTDHCAMASTNTVTVEAKAAATVTKIVDSWYVKKDRRTPDVELVKTTGATGFTVKIGSTVIWNSDGSNITGFGGCGFHMGENGIIYLNGTKDNGDAPAHDDGTWAAGDETLTITAIGCGSSASQNITIHKQAATDYKEIAFVVDGEKGKGFDQVTSLHADGTELYEYLDTVTAAGNRLFKLTERNIYSTTDEKAIREEYSQFDGILITDDPSTNTVVKTGDDYKTKGYVNAFGTMVDVRPIFTMEAYVSALKNWGSKGIKGNPQSPNPRQYEMRLECKDHEIYGAGLPTPEDGTNVWEEVVDGETFRHVILVDSTLGIYKGVKYNQETKGNEKPALQGFTGEAAGSLLGLGRILEGTLQAAIERQEEPAARLLVMGINAKALQPTCALTDEGKTVIKNILVYLLKTNMEEVDDCSNYFTGKYDNDWSKAGNWSKNQLPSSEAKVRILAPCVISGIQPHVLQVSIVNSGNSNIRNTARGSAVCDGTLTIEPDGALIADGKIRSAVAPHFAANDLMPTTPEMLTINTNGSGQAALIFNNDAGDTKATVNLYSLGRTLSGANQFQYMAVPMEYVAVNPAFANEHNDGKLIYTYVWHENGGWERRGYYTDLYAFEGVGITTTDTEARIYTMEGNLASTAERTIALTHDSKPAYGNNIIGNSWMAPIDIASLKNAIGDDAAVMKTVYIYCTGKDPANATSNSLETAGQWLAIPIDAAGWFGWGGVKVIPAMQAFLIRVSSETSLTLNYNEMVRTTATENLNVPLRAPRRKVEGEDVNKAISLTRMRVADSKTCTDLYLFEGSDFSGEFDNGWEATYMPGDGRSAQFYAMEEKTKMAVLATDELEGTPVCFAPGKESNYTISFFGGDGTYYLNDLKEQTSTLIEQGNTYSFIYEAGDMPQRFLISSTPFEKPGVATGTETVNNSEKARKVVYQDKIYIIRGGRIYDVVGKMVK